jgi:Complex I intermediate-associated protein 30 (CIA30)
MLISAFMGKESKMSRSTPSSVGRLATLLLLLWPPGIVAAAVPAGSESGAHDGRLVIADFDSGKLETAAGLAWMVVADEQLGGTSEASLAIIRPGARGSNAAMRVTFNLGEGFAYPFAGVWALPGSEGLPADFTAYRGLRFYARSEKGGTFMAGLRQVSGAPANYMAAIAVKPEWTLVEVPFDKLQRVPPSGPPQPFVAKDVSSIGFNVAGRVPGQLALDVDQVELYK